MERTCRGEEDDIGERWKESKLIRTLQIDISLFSLSCLYCVCLLYGGELNESVCVKTVMDVRGAACFESTHEEVCSSHLATRRGKKASTWFA